MSEVTRVDIPQVNSVADDLLRYGTSVSEAFGVVKSELEKNWGSWGEDQYGRQFSEKWAPQTEELMEAVLEMLDGITDFGEGLRKVTVAFAELDVNSGESLSFKDE